MDAFMRPPLLLVPGPVPLHPAVQEEMAKPAVPHYGEAFIHTYRETIDLLRHIWSSPDGRVFPIMGPGHAGLESIAFTFLRRGDRVVVQENGFFGGGDGRGPPAPRGRGGPPASAWGGG